MLFVGTFYNNNKTKNRAKTDYIYKIILIKIY